MRLAAQGYYLVIVTTFNLFWVLERQRMKLKLPGTNGNNIGLPILNSKHIDNKQVRTGILIMD
jgi:hypothetical protein